MKNFRKNEQGFYICEECMRTFSKINGLSNHIKYSHKNINKKEYYDKWIKENKEGICKICENNTVYTGFKYGYQNCCSKKCSNEYSHLRSEEENIKKFGVKNAYQRTEIKEKIKHVNLEKTGFETPFHKDNPIRKRWEKRLFDEEGITNVFQRKDVKEKSKQTKKERYGDENYRDIEKFKQTCLKTYGVEHPSQNVEIHKKQQKGRFQIHKYKNTNLWYQGSYELDFVEKYLKLFPDIRQASSIKYEFNKKNKVYYPDFYIPLLNLVVEIKSSWTLKIDLEIEEKKKATIANGFKYIMILDKNYNEFNKFIFQSF